MQDAGAGKISDHDDDGIERRDGERQENCALPLCPELLTEPTNGDDGVNREPIAAFGGDIKPPRSQLIV